MADIPYSEKILELAGKWADGTITESEKTTFIDWYNRFDDRELLLPTEYAPLMERIEMEMLAHIRQRIAGDASPPSEKQPSLLFRLKPWRLRSSIAAAILAAIALTGVLLITNHRSAPAPATAQQKHPAPADILPGSNRAILTLADGSTISLDSAHTGNLASQGTAKVLKIQDGELKYAAVAADNQSKASYNTLSTPRGGQYKLLLADGTRVWLNAASSIRYPTTFTGPDREVEISGEAYFEIAKNAAMPFRVLTVSNPGDKDPMTIDVLGTHFNVNAYIDEPVVRTTLLEGLVKVSKGNNTALLKPGQAAQVRKDGAIQQIQDADLEAAVAWKDGLFEFSDEELPAIMRQISRWYDIDVEYAGAVPTDKFTGSVSRNTTLSGVLKILKLSDIQVSVSNNKIIVKS
jgi:ferric-dicitrate binding protein FerR (iron transport regulator)